MRSKFSYFLISFGLLALLLVPVADAQVCTPAAPGLVSWWSGDGNALDSRSRQNGTLSGTSFVAGQTGQAIRISAPSPTDLFSADGSGALNITGEQVTIEGWLRLENNNAHPAQAFTGVIGKNGFPNDQPYMLFFESGALAGGGNLPADQWQFSYTLMNNSGLRVSNQNSNVIVSAGTFNHVAMTYNGSQPSSGNVKLYVNGVLQATNIIPIQQITGQLISSPSEPFIMLTGGSPFEADEIAIYNRELSAAEIAAIHNAGTAGKCKPTATAEPLGLVGWWSGDGNANDISASSFNAMLQNGAGYAIGKVGQAFNFTARDQYVDIPNDPALFPQAGFSLETWIRPESYVGCNPTSNVMRIAHSVPTINRGWLTQITCNGNPIGPGFLRAGIFDQNSTLNIFGSSQALPAGEFTHFAFTWDGSTMRLYVNGILEASQATTNLGMGVNTENVRLGNATDFGFLGQIDEPSVYGRALSSDEIQSIYNAGAGGKLKQELTRSGQVGFWRAEGNANDSSGYGNNGSPLNGVGFGPGKFGQAFVFDGVDDHVSIPFNSSFISPTYSVDAWIKPLSPVNDLIPQELIVGQDRGRIQLVARPEGSNWRPVFQFFATDQSFPEVISSQTLPLNQYSHVAGTWDGSTMRIYVNGSLTGSSVPGKIPASLECDLFIGGFGTTSTGTGCGNTAFQYANAEIDEVSIYNRELLASEIAEIFGQGSAFRPDGVSERSARAETPRSNKSFLTFGEPVPVTTAVGDVTLTFDEVTTGGTTQQIPLTGAGLPALPSNPASTLFYDIATSAEFSGNVGLCFNLPSFTTAEVFATLFVLHLENGVWANRTTTRDFASRTVCAQTTSLSPFAIAPFAPTSASGAIQGRVTTSVGFGIPNATITLTGGNLTEPRLVLTNSFGYFQIGDVAVGQTYIAEIRAKRATFINPVRVINVKDSIFILDFVSDSP